MTDLRKAAEMALEALDYEPESFVSWTDKLKDAREALRQALAQPEEWVGLTGEEFKRFSFNAPWEVIQEIEAKLKEKNKC